MTELPARPSNATLAAFTGPCLPFAALGLPLVVHLPAYYAENVGLPLGVVGAVFMLVKLIDIPLDPILGGMMDRTRTRFGRFRPWMAAGAPLLMLASFLLFMPPAGAGPLFLATWLMAIYVGFSIVVLAQTSWASTLSPDYNQRSRIYAWWQVGNVVGMLLVLVLPVVITMTGGTQTEAVAAMGWFIVILLPITVGFAVWKVPESAPSEASHARLSDYLAFFRLTTVRRLMLADLLFGLAPGITGALALFYFKAAKGMDAGQANILIFLYFLAGLIGAPLWSLLAVGLGKHRALALAGVLYAAVYTGVLFAPAGNFPLLALSMLLVGLPFSASPLLCRAMLADVADELRLAQGEDRTGMLFALLTATNKVGYAVALVTYFPLAWAGFDKTAGAVNTPFAINVLTALFVAAPMVLLLLGAASIFRFPLDEARQREVRAALEAQGATR